MKFSTDDTLGKLRSSAKKIAYSTPIRKVAEKAGAAKKPAIVDKVISRSPLAHTMRSLGSEVLPEGNYYLRLRIEDWEPILGESFQLLYRGKMLYGNVVEPPEKQYPLEYRNIVADSNDISDYEVRLVTGRQAGESLKFNLDFSDGAFSTDEQIRYDERFHIRRHGKAYYALRGNTKGPKKIIFSFPGLGMSVGRIVYPVSTMKDIRESDLQDALMVVFQDRYLVPGSYMLLDSLGRSIHKDISAVIKNFKSAYGLGDGDLFFFGASKGASSAIYYAKDFPGSDLLVSTPQLHLPSYFVKPALRDNLYMQQGFYTMESAGDLLTQYIDEGRRVHLFYTNNDELSNQSFIEFDQPGQNLTKYRIPGVHTAVARDALGSIVGIMRNFLGTAEESHGMVLSATVNEIQVRPGNLVKVALELSEPYTSGNYNWYLRDKSGRTAEQLYMLTIAPNKQSLYTNAEAMFNLRLDDLHREFDIVGITNDGRMIRGEIQNWMSAIEESVDNSIAVIEGPSLLDFTTNDMREHVIVNRYKVASFVYRATLGDASADSIRIIFVDDVVSAAAPTVDSQHVVTVVCSVDSDMLVDVFVLRSIARVGAQRANIDIECTDDALARAISNRVKDIDWKEINIRTSEEC